MGRRPQSRRRKMSRRRRKVIALLPFALFPAALITPSISTAAAPLVLAASDEALVDRVAPEITEVPDEAVDVPASVSTPGVVVPQDDAATSTVPAASTTSANGIPSAALAAYQRAETVINASDTACHLSWELLAAVGRVESDHGRYGGNQLDANGVATPGIIGIALNGSNNTSRISDSDDGEYDGDTQWDRAVGPMQFIPTTWSVVGVDADGDSQRNPQDIDDAALGAAVYLCSGDDDLGTDAGRRSAVYRYNHSQSYVSLVLRLYAAYQSGEFSEVPDTTPTGTSTPVTTPVDTGGGDDGDNGDDVSTGPNDPVIQEPPDIGDNERLSEAEAAAQCTAEGKVNNPLRTGDDWDRCVANYTD